MKKKILLPPLIILVIVIVAGVGLAGASLLIGNTGDNSPTTAIDLQRGLVGWWKFDGNASDSTPNQNDGTASNVTLTTDRKGQANKAYSFDGNDYIQVSDSPSFDTVESNNRITVSAWVKRNSDQGPSTPNFRTIATRGAYSAVGNSWIFVWDSTNSELEFVVNANANRITESLSLTADTWYHVVATYDGSNLRLYFNGALLGTPVAEATGFGGSTNNTIYMGSDESGSDRYWRGSLGDVRIYNRALSTTEITALYDSYNPGIQVSDLQKGLVGHWKMDGNANDFSAYRNNGTVTGATLTTDRKEQANKAYDFDGDDLIDLGSSSVIMPATFTVTAWVKYGGSGSYAPLLGFGGSSDSPGIYLNYTGLGTPLIYMGGSNYRYFDRTTNFYDNQWHFVAFIVPGSAQSSISSSLMYVDGVSQVAGAATATSGQASKTNVYIGSQHTKRMSGSVDDLRIYNRVLTSAEITALYDSYNPGVQISNLQKGLVGHWKMDGNANDFSAYRNNGTVTGATLTTDRKGQISKAYEFDGAGSNNINIGDISAVELTTVTFSFWAKVNTNAADGDFIIKGRHFTNRPLLIFYDDVVASSDVGSGNTNTLSVLSYDGTTQHWVAATNDALNDTNWHHIVVIIDPSNNKTDIYIDGNLNRSNTKTWNGIQSTSDQIRFGADDQVPTAPASLNGKIDDVRIYNRALSAIEITQLYESY